MSKLDSSKTPGLFIDIGQTVFQAVQAGDAFSFPLERGENGRLTDLCRERLTVNLRGYLGRKGRSGEKSAMCALGARGVSMRRLILPASSDEELQRVLRLQIESEFPLSPDDLAWGSRSVGPAKSAGNGGPARQELLVVAVKKEVLEEYTGVLTACGVAPRFTLAALARTQLHPPPSGACAVLDIGRTHSELLTFDNGVPSSIRILAWGGDDITRSIQEKLGVSHDEAEKLKLTMDQPGSALGPQGPALQIAAQSALTALARSLKPAALGAKLYLTGRSARDPRLGPLLGSLLGGAVPCENLPSAAGEGPSTAIAGLMKAAAGNGAPPPLLLQLGGGQRAVRAAQPAILKWAVVAACLAAGAFLFPYAEAIVCKPMLEKKLASLEAERGRLAMIDEELDFLKFVKQNQLPCLEAVYLLARSAPQGTQLQSLSLGRHQDVALKLKLGDNQQVTDFRSKLIDSGWFGNVMVEEQTPEQDRTMSVRMTAALKPPEARKPITAEPPGKKKDDHYEPVVWMPPQAPPRMAPPSAPPMSAPVQVAPGPPTEQPNPGPPAPGRRRPRQIIITPQ